MRDQDSGYPTPAAVREQLLTADAFSDLSQVRVAREIIELKIAEISADYLEIFGADKKHREAIRDVPVLRKEQVQAYSAAARALKNIDPGESRHLLERARDAREKLEEWRRLRGDDRLSKARTYLKRDASLRNRFMVDLFVVFSLTTRMKVIEIESGILPDVLIALRASYPELLPRTGFSSPRTRIKRYLDRALRLYRDRDPSVKRQDLFRNRAHLLFDTDPRFPSGLFQRRGPARTPSR